MTMYEFKKTRVVTGAFPWLGFVALAQIACAGGSSSGADARELVSADAVVTDASVRDATSIDATPVDATPVDAGVPADAFTGVCNPVTQAGCGLGQKCAQLVENQDPFLARTACVPDGNVTQGNACTRGVAGAATGFDDCRAGLDCLSGVCTSICDIGPPDGCRTADEAFGDGEYCTLFENLFSDNIGLCVAGCDPVDDTVLNGTVTSTDCGAGNGCYLNAPRGVAACAGTPAPASGVSQNEDCYGPSSGGCFLNGCASGFTALLNNTPLNATGSVCARYCTPVVTHATASDSPEGAAGNCSLASLDAAGGTNGNSSAHQCRFVQKFYSNTDNVPVEVGMCVPVLPLAGGTWGDCTTFDWDGIQTAWNGAVNAGTDPNDAFNDHCLVTPSDPMNSEIQSFCLGIFRGCISIEEEDAGLLEPVTPFQVFGGEPYVSPAKAQLRSLISSRQEEYGLQL